MYVIVNKEGNFNGITYDKMNADIKAHHSEDTILWMDSAPVDANLGSLEPDADYVPGYGSPTADQIAASAVAMINMDNRAYLDSTDYYAVRFAETGKAMPEGMQIKRQAARDAIVD